MAEGQRIIWKPLSRPQADFCASTETEVLYGGAKGCAKLLPLSCLVPTHYGFSTIGELGVGSQIFDEQGAPTTVVQIHPIDPEPDAYRITFDDGSTVECDAGHRWLTFDAREREQFLRRSPGFRARRRATRKSRVGGRKSETFTETITSRNRRHPPPTKPLPTGTVRSTLEILATLEVKKGVVMKNHAVPVAGALQLPHAPLALDPYVLGVWLGDGSSSAGTWTCSPKDAAEMAPYIEAVGFRVSHHVEPTSHGIQGLVPLLRMLGVLNNKHVPQAYLRASPAQRLALLQGLMDTDGTASKDTGAVSFANTNRLLIDAAYELVVSLGMRATINESRARLNGEDHGPYWHMKWTARMPVFRLRRKLAIQKIAASPVTRFRYIVAVEPVAPEPMRCISVANKSGLFLVGRSMIPTHNSDAILFASLQQVHLDRYKALILRQTFPEVQELIDRSHRAFPEISNPPSWKGDLKRWTFPGGGIVQFGYCRTKEEVQRYHGQEWAYIGFDEVGDVQDERVWVMLMAENRCPNPEVIRMMRGTANPGKPGHPWVKRRFIDKCGKLGEKIYRYEYRMPGLPPAVLTRRFIPARVTDNPIYANDPIYMATLFQLPEILRRQLLYGDWDAGFGMALDELEEGVHIVAPFPIPGNWVQFGSFDWGYQHPWVFGHYAVNEDGLVFKLNSYTGRLQSDREIAEAILNYVPVDRLRYIVAGHDCWAQHKARRDDSTPSTEERFAEHDIYLTRANVARYAGLRQMREMTAWKGRLPGGEDGEPDFYMMDTPGNRKCFESLKDMIVNPDDPEDALKVDADPITGEGGDDSYDETRYALSSRPGRAKSMWEDREVRAFSRETLIFEMERRKHTSRHLHEGPDYGDLTPEAATLL